MTSETGRKADQARRENVMMRTIINAMAEEEKVILKAVYTHMASRPRTVVVVSRRKRKPVTAE